MLKEILRKTPLQTRFKVSTELAFINLITELGYRENKYWTDDEDEVLNRLCELAEEFSEDLIEEYKQWKKDNE